MSALIWAYDSHENELDPELKAAAEFRANETGEPSEAEQTEPILLRNLLTDDQIDDILQQASVDGVWPRGVSSSSSSAASLPVDTIIEASPPPCHQHRFVECLQNDDDMTKKTLNSDLQSVPHHLAWTDEHVVLYMHMNDHWFVRAFGTPWSIILGGMEIQPWMEGVAPVLDEQWIGSDDSMKLVRCVELHHYSAGGGLVTPGHRDWGSDRTISVLLSDPDDVAGGDFVTYESDGTPVAHPMRRGDAILFQSEKLHNISTITAGVRQSLVVELWPSKRY
ncbi:expressed unknown protein [Seminavis robusta]|uniref:Fe2OG dioxygenase domain-containing protein n=1 Tax=Seminavis robusta TaxID=568900 RepID=A0A9N8HQL8_9STRA|nr:expressed unknown protein [Seminavis robusta]|eukprot:Sro1458_g274430.1 n/a (279) ;mRNA; r:17608-18444